MGGGNSKHLIELLEPVINSLECELWGLEYHSSGRGHGTLRIYIDRPEGIGLSDCEKVSRQVSAVLDVEDPIQSEFTLEVSTPGMDRPLYTIEQFTAYANEQVKIKLKIPFEDRRHITGLLLGAEKDEIKVLADGHEYLLPIESIDKANVVPDFAKSSKKKANAKPKGE